MNNIAEMNVHRGQRAFHSGRAAELQVVQEYARRGNALVHERWRGKGGEIDLILRDGDGLIFVEVKKSRSIETAALSLSARQINRLRAAADEFLATQPLGNLTNVRLDVALVGGDGQFEILENALA